MPNTRTPRLLKWQRLLLIISGSALWLSGLIWLVLHYFVQIKGEFGAETNPLEPWFLSLHGLALIPALLGLGGLLVAHIPKGWKYVNQRVAGTSLTVLAVILVLSGYLLYYIGDDLIRNWVSLVHWVLGLAAPIIFIWHQLGSGRKARDKHK